MKWTINIRPVDTSLNAWVWTAEREDGETAMRGGADTRDGALEDARAEVREQEAAFAIIEENSTTEEYTPTEIVLPEEPLPMIEVPKMPMLRLEPS